MGNKEGRPPATLDSLAELAGGGRVPQGNFSGHQDLGDRDQPGEEVLDLGASPQPFPDTLDQGEFELGAVTEPFAAAPMPPSPGLAAVAPTSWPSLAAEPDTGSELQLTSAADQTSELAGWQTSSSATLPDGIADAESLPLELEVEDIPSASTPRGTLFGGTAVTTEKLPHAADLSMLSSSVSTAQTTPNISGQGSTAPADRAGEVTQFFALVEKAVKLLNLYEGRRDTTERAIDQAAEQLGRALASGPLVLSVTPYEFVLDGETVYVSQEDRKGLSYRLFRDGLRQLQLLPGLERAELVTLVEIMNATGQRRDEDDAITLLWNANLAHVRYVAVDVFLEGRLDTENAGLQERVQELLTFCAVPLHEKAVPMDLRDSLARLDPAALDQACLWRQQLLASLPAKTPAVPMAEMSATSKDLWQRLACLLDALQADGDPGTMAQPSPSVGRLFAPVLDELWRQGQWEALGQAAQAAAELQRRQPGQNSALTVALALLATQERLLGLETALQVQVPAVLGGMLALIRMLPTSADTVLAQLLARLPDGSAQDQLAGLLIERGADLTEWQTRRLRSPNLAVVSTAIDALQASPSPVALKALRSLLKHANPRVQIQAVRAIGQRFNVADVPALVAALGVDSRELQELCLDALERLPPGSHAVALVEALKQPDVDDWPANRRTRLLALLVRWGGSEATDFVVKRLSAKNPFRRARLEAERTEMLEVVQRVGGRRAQNLLDAALQSRPPEAARAALETARQRLGNRS